MQNKVVTMKRRLVHKGNRVYIKHLTTNYALVSYLKDGFNKVFSLPIEELVSIK